MLRWNLPSWLSAGCSASPKEWIPIQPDSQTEALLVYPSIAESWHPCWPSRRVWLEIFEGFTKECPVLDPERSDLNKIQAKQYSLSKGKVHKGRVKMVSRAARGAGADEGGVTHRLQRRLRGWLQGLM
jgi:hypothetical protein